MTEPGPLIASGRDADIFAYGDSLVLRRSRQGRSMVGEAEVMEYVRGHGYPVPAVDHLSDDGTEMVMERIAGLSMVEVIGKKPWTIRAQGETLAELHRRLHLIPAPEAMDRGPGAEGTALLHLDLHPLNVIVGPSGPVVIDWTNARRGEGATDVALTWVLMAAGTIPGNRLKAALMGRARGLLVGRFLTPFLAGSDRAAVISALRSVVDWKVGDPHMSAAEIAGMWDVVEKAEASVPS